MVFPFLDSSENSTFDHRFFTFYDLRFWKIGKNQWKNKIPFGFNFGVWDFAFVAFRFEEVENHFPDFSFANLLSQIPIEKIMHTNLEKN